MLKIALTTSNEPKNYYIRTRYISVLLKMAKEAGVVALPVVLPMVEDKALIRAYAQEFDGFLFTGGDDLAPSYYGEETLPACGAIFPERDTFELSLLSEVIQLNKPVFGICRGLQTINVFCGGSLWQDFPTQCPREEPHCHKDDRGATYHAIYADHWLRELLGKTELITNSYHHQVVKELGAGLRAVGFSQDGFVEALEHETYPFMKAVQWHPEIDPDENSQLLYRSFLEAVSQRKAKE